MGIGIGLRRRGVYHGIFNEYQEEQANDASVFSLDGTQPPSLHADEFYARRLLFFVGA